MIEIVQHIPTFVDMRDDPVPRASFSTLDELLAIPWVSYRKSTVGDEPFYCRWDNSLMIEGMRDGHRTWWVIGFVEPTEILDELPTWQSPRCPNCGGHAWAGGGLPEHTWHCNACDRDFEV